MEFPRISSPYHQKNKRMVRSSIYSINQSYNLGNSNLTDNSVSISENESIIYSEKEILSKENKRLKEIIDKKCLQVHNLKNDNLELNDKYIQQSFKLETVENQLKKLSFPIEQNKLDSMKLIAQQNVYTEKLQDDFNNLNEKYDILKKQNQILIKKSDDRSNLVEKIEYLEKQIKSYQKEIFDLNVQLRRTPPQESIQFQSEIDKIKQIILSHREPSAEIKQEIHNLKSENDSLKKFLNLKDNEIDRLQNDLKKRDKEIIELKIQIENEHRALYLMTKNVTESKTRENHLENSLRQKLDQNSLQTTVFKYTKPNLSYNH